MQVDQVNLNLNGYILRGLYSYPEESIGLVVMFHGFTGHKNENGYMFKQLTNTLVNIGYSTLRYDFMGSGESDGEFADFTLETLLNDGSKIVEEAYRLNNNKPIILMGMSMGGAIASRVSLLKKDKIEKLVLLSPAANIGNIVDNIFERTEMDENGNIDMGGYFINVKLKKSFEEYNFYKDVETFEKPVLITQGSLDKSVFPQFSKQYDDLYPNSTYVLIEGAEHCYTRVPYRIKLNQVVEEFVKKSC